MRILKLFKLISTIVLLGILLSCVHSYYFVYELSVTSNRNSIPSHNVVTTNDVNRYIYKYDDLEFKFRLTGLGLSVSIYNNTDSPVILHWSNSSISTDSQPEEAVVVHIRNNSQDLERFFDLFPFPQPSTTLLPSKNLWTRINPKSLSKWSKYTNSDKGYWKLKKAQWNLKPRNSQSDSDMKALGKKALNHSLALILKIEIDGSVETFEFNIRAVKAIVKGARW